VVRELLMREWDLIGVRGIPEAEDEYDRYVGKVYVMLMDEHANAEVITAYLLNTATGHMGLRPDPALAQRSSRVAEKLISLRPSFHIN
jgi:hypothetical protein